MRKARSVSRAGWAVALAAFIGVQLSGAETDIWECQALDGSSYYSNTSVPGCRPLTLERDLSRSEGSTGKGFANKSSPATLRKESGLSRPPTTNHSTASARLSSRAFHEGVRIIPTVSVSSSVLEQKEKGIHGAAPGSAIPIQLTVRYLQAGTGPVVEADARVREGTLSSVKAAVVASALAVGYDPRFLEVRVDVLANFTWYRGLKLDGGSAGIGFAVGVASAILGDKLQESTCLTGTIEKDGRVGPVGSIYYKLEGCHMLFPRSRFILPAGQSSLEVISNASRFSADLFEVQNLAEAYQAATGSPLRTVN